jgi:hypothetical protein
LCILSKFQIKYRDLKEFDQEKAILDKIYEHWKEVEGEFSDQSLESLIDIISFVKNKSIYF